MDHTRLAAAVMISVATAASFVCASGVAAQTAVTSLPRPTGNMSVATTIVRMVDSTRSTRGESSGQGKRELLVQLWYPRSPTRVIKTAPYIPDERVLEAIARNNPDSSTVRAWKNLETSALIDVDAMALPWKVPFLVFSHGLGTARSSYTALAQEIASYGNVVALIDHPYGGVTVLQNGEVVTADMDTTAGWVARSAAIWAADAAFVATTMRNYLEARNSPPILRHAAYLTDWNKVGMLGHSLGGVAAFEACRVDKRFKACVNMDGANIAMFESTGIPRPTMLLRSQPQYSDEELAAKGRTRAAWDELGENIKAEVAKVLGKNTNVPAFSVQFAGTNHSHFSDYPFVYPQSIARFGGRNMDSNRVFTLTSEYVRSFFDCYMQGGRRTF
jgi:dienelactone hydrolase